MEGIPLDQDTLNQFQNEFNNGSPAGSPEDAAPGGGDPVAQLNEAVGWLLKTADSALRKKDERLGTDPESIKRISELSVLVARRNISDDILRNSPELFLGTILTGLAIEKGIVLKQIQEENAAQNNHAQESADSGNKEDNEQ